MKLEVLEDAAAVAQKASAFIAAEVRRTVAAKGSFTFAVSGGRTPWVMLRALANENLPWADVQIVQVDERVAPAGDPDRNLTHLRESLLSHAPLPPDNVHAMPVEQGDLAAAAESYGQVLESLAGSPPRLDLIHLGLGPDGHTASLVPGDPVLEVEDALVGTTGAYQDHYRMTLTYPVLNQARQVLFVVTGAEKRDALAKLRRQDPGIPAGRVRAKEVLVMADQAAAEGMEHG